MLSPAIADSKRTSGTSSSPISFAPLARREMRSSLYRRNGSIGTLRARQSRRLCERCRDRAACAWRATPRARDRVQGDDLRLSTNHNVLTIVITPNDARSNLVDTRDVRLPVVASIMIRSSRSATTIVVRAGSKRFVMPLSAPL